MIDATVVGAGPNGLAAAVTLAAAGLEVQLIERAGRVGGGMSSAELTLPGFVHDVCSAVHPGALASPFFRAWGLEHRVPLAIPDASYAHPLDGRDAAIAYLDLDRTVDELGPDGPGWRRFVEPLVEHFAGVQALTGGPLLRWPSDPTAARLFGTRALRLAAFGGVDAQGRGATPGRLGFATEAGAALSAGTAAHTVARLNTLGAAGAGLLLAAFGHTVGYPVPIGGSQAIADALAADFTERGGTIRLGEHVASPADIEPSRVTILDTSPEFLASYAGEKLPAGYRRALGRYRRGDGVAKIDFATSAPIPWADARVGAAPTVHLGGTRTEIAAAEAEVAAGRIPSNPYVLLTQPTVIDPSRAPEGQHTVWAYTHVPAGSDADLTETITAQIERFAPGFRDTILASAHRSAAQLALENPNDPGGEMMGGAVTVPQLIARPVLSRAPWRTPVAGLYLGSAATPPGPSTHGMNGWYAAATALRDHFGIRTAPFSA
ncbi:NAD(P)/FAD-dependent oxidoreductase [Schumannella luteola]|uniref:Phytoene dehydrogenase-like protein n=1 Tax=Schumannella luteola TaxID=472059 RepID=A0A852YAH4_9MICO|nr:NAD(P)/FAD-dependent oxidoreductase [Schumannella luteola]NYG98360.1 phytoene dehydrogenase-like protein [Schumannella luteola]TPX05781.1 NAD(P)/FAD-dependent oxidoreductase [Schumannella luteola]